MKLAAAVLANLLQRDGGQPVPVPAGVEAPRIIAHLARTLMSATDRAYGLPQTLGHVHRIASLSRDRLSLEAWRTLNAFYVGHHWQSGRVLASTGESLDMIDAGLGAIAAFNGLTHENMTRNFGWSFLDMGRRMTRAANLAQLLLTTLQPMPGETSTGDRDESGRLLFVLELADCFITYRSRYRLNPMIAPVLDLLLVDESNPRSLAFQLAALNAHIDTLPQTGNGGGRTEVQRTALAMFNDVRLADVVALADSDDNGRRSALVALLGAQVERIPRLSDAITRRYFSVVEREPTWVRARSRQDS